MNDRTLRLIVVHDPNSAESRKMMDAITEEMDVETIELQRVSRVLPGVRAVPAVGIVMWMTDLQGIATDVASFATYVHNEELVRNALETLHIDANADSVADEALVREAAIQAAVHYLPDAVAVQQPASLYDDWHENVEYVVNDLRLCDGTLYRCRGTHISTTDYRPTAAPSLWRKLPWPDVE